MGQGAKPVSPRFPVGAALGGVPGLFKELTQVTVTLDLLVRKKGAVSCHLLRASRAEKVTVTWPAFEL